MQAFDSVLGHAGAIVRHPDSSLEGATDPRADGVVAAFWFYLKVQENHY